MLDIWMTADFWISSLELAAVLWMSVFFLGLIGSMILVATGHGDKLQAFLEKQQAKKFARIQAKEARKNYPKLLEAHEELLKEYEEVVDNFGELTEEFGELVKEHMELREYTKTVASERINLMRAAYSAFILLDLRKDQLTKEEKEIYNDLKAVIYEISEETSKRLNQQENIDISLTDSFEEEKEHV